MQQQPLSRKWWRLEAKVRNGHQINSKPKQICNGARQSNDTSWKERRQFCIPLVPRVNRFQQSFGWRIRTQGRAVLIHFPQWQLISPFRRRTDPDCLGWELEWHEDSANRGNQKNWGYAARIGQEVMGSRLYFGSWEANTANKKHRPPTCTGVARVQLQIDKSVAWRADFGHLIQTCAGRTSEVLWLTFCDSKAKVMR